MTISVHRFVRFADVDSYLRLGWIARPTLAGTHHGEYSVHLEWLCDCFPLTPLTNTHFRESAHAAARA